MSLSNDKLIGVTVFDQISHIIAVRADFALAEGVYGITNRRWRQEMKGADGNMSWTFRCVENSTIVTVRWTLNSRNLTYAVEKAGPTTASCPGILKTTQTGPSTSPSVTCATGRTNYGPPISLFQPEFPTAGVGIVANLSTRTPTTPGTDTPHQTASLLHPNDTAPPLCYPYLNFSGLSRRSISTRIISQIPDHSFPSQPPQNDVPPSIHAWSMAHTGALQHTRFQLLWCPRAKRSQARAASHNSRFWCPGARRTLHSDGGTGSVEHRALSSQRATSNNLLYPTKSTQSNLPTAEYGHFQKE